MSTTPDPNIASRIAQTCRRLEASLGQELSIEVLAQEAGLSVFYFHRLFRGITGESIRGYTRRLRLEKAVHRLRNGDEEILKIALSLGYSSHESFTRAFAKRFAQTPSECRKGAQLEPARSLATPSELVDFSIEERTPCLLACVRHVGPYDQVGNAWKQLMKWGWAKTLFRSPEMLGLCHDDPDVTAPERVRYDACLVVPPGTRTRGEVMLREQAGGTFASAIHEGPYEELGQSYAQLFAKVINTKANNRQWRLGDPPTLETYLNDPRKTPAQRLRTKIWIAVSPASGQP